MRAEGHRVWQEIDGVDIVSRSAAGELWAIECKRAFSLKVLAQAHAAKGHCHRRFIAVPAAFPDAEERYGQRIAKADGIGIMRVAKPNQQGVSAVRIALQAKRCGQPDARFDPWLVDRAEDHAAAGSAAAAAWTPFKETVERLRQHLAAHGGRQPLRVALRAVDHHYRNDDVAAGSLAKILREDGIDGLALLKADGRLVLVCG